MVKVPVVDEDTCIDCGNCAEVCPRVFEIVDEKSQVIGPDQCGTCNCHDAMPRAGDQLGGMKKPR